MTVQVDGREEVAVERIEDRLDGRVLTRLLEGVRPDQVARRCLRVGLVERHLVDDPRCAEPHDHLDGDRRVVDLQDVEP